LYYEGPSSVWRGSFRRLIRRGSDQNALLGRLVQEDANKVIARTFDIAEATVKVNINSGWQ
jgi:FixJ family two-component response regulator